MKISSNNKRKNRTRAMLTVAVFGVAVSLLSIASLALFTDTASVTDNQFTTGTVDISTAPATAVVTDLAMAPGDQVTAPLSVSNAGTLDLRYAVESTTDEDTLAAELVMTIKSGVTTCDDTNWTADGTTLYSGRLGSTLTDAVIGDATAGADLNDRTLAATNSEVLCFNVSLPIAAVAQGVTTTATFDFIAEQTVNNP